MIFKLKLERSKLRGKQCTHCFEVKSRDDFYLGNDKDGRSYWCKACAKKNKNREKDRIYHAKYRKEHPVETQSQQMLNRAIYSGKMLRQACSACGRHPSQAHHIDYTKPFKVIWLCATCHRRWHAKFVKNRIVTC